MIFLTLAVHLFTVAKAKFLCKKILISKGLPFRVRLMLGLGLVATQYGGR